jgi:hypothetical protein
MLPFGVTIPATVLQRSEIPEELMNYPVFRSEILCKRSKRKKVSNSRRFWLQVRSQTGSAVRPTGYTKSLLTFSNYSMNAMGGKEKILSQLVGDRVVKIFITFNGNPMLCIVLKRTCIFTWISYANKNKVTFFHASESTFRYSNQTSTCFVVTSSKIPFATFYIRTRVSSK